MRLAGHTGDRAQVQLDGLIERSRGVNEHPVDPGRFELVELLGTADARLGFDANSAEVTTGLALCLSLASHTQLLARAGVRSLSVLRLGLGDYGGGVIGPRGRVPVGVRDVDKPDVAVVAHAAKSPRS